MLKTLLKALHIPLLLKRLRWNMLQEHMGHSIYSGGLNGF